MHSEDMSDHDLLSSLIDKRQDCAESDVERFGVDKLKEFELKHRTLSLHLRRNVASGQLTRSYR